MGIGNTTVGRGASAAALYGGAGGGLDRARHRAGRRRRWRVKTPWSSPRRWRHHAAALRDPLEALGALGGRELAAMAGAILRARHLRIPVILDGFICCAAAAVS